MADSTTSTEGRQSFFDDDNLDIKFDWVKLDKTPYAEILHETPIQKDNWTRTNANSSTTVQAYFLLYRRCIVQFKNNTAKQPEVVLEIANSRFKAIVKDGVYGFSLSKNGNTYDFTTKDEAVSKKWATDLRGICILLTFHEEYKAIKMIGRGSFAKVYLVESKGLNKSFAVKAFTKESIILSNKSNAKPSMINEIDIMRCTNHPNIIQLYEVFETDKSIYLVLELIQGKSLQDILKKPTFKEQYPESKCASLILSLLDALAYLGAHNIMHRDLKPDNILIDKGDKLKIVDFGLATFINIDDYIFKKCGTPGYIAPEVFKYDAKVPSTAYDDRCDVFSAGCILFYMLFGFPFFDGSNASEILKMNRKFSLEFEALNTVTQEIKNPSSKHSKEALDLLRKLLEFDHKLRPRAVETLKHPFVISISLESMKSLNMTDSTSDMYGKYSEGGSFSPVLKPTDFGLSKSNNNANKERYEQKDSLYIDLGQPLINGRTDTISGVNSHNNSLLLLGQPPSNNAGSTPTSLSRFASGSPGLKKDPNAKGRMSGGNNLLKAAIFKNAEKNNVNSPGTEEESPLRSPTNIGFSGKSDTLTGDYNDNTGEEIDDDSNENTLLQTKLQKINSGTLTKHPSKPNSPSLRARPLENKGVSPFAVAKNLKSFEETKSPSDR